jgi:radical SAM superfamily enzyme YgiQ (UPF0313 family)
MPLAAAVLTGTIAGDSELKEGYTTSFSDFYLKDDTGEIAQQIIDSGAAVAGFSVYSWNREKFIELADLIREKKGEMVLFAGGAEATADPERLLYDGNFDFVISGEGELPLTEALKALQRNESLGAIDAIYTRIPDGGDSAKERSWAPEDLNTIPSPFINGTLQPSKYEGILWELSRGCPFKCSFCFESRGNSSIRYYSIDRLEKELEIFEEQKVNQIFVLDPTFNYNKKRAKEILTLIQKKAPLIHYTFEVRSEFIDTELADLFASLNCSLQIGLQSIHPEVLKNINRSFNDDDFIEKITLLNERGVIFGMDLIYGLPGDTYEGFLESLDFALSLQPNHLDIFPLSVLPGTELYDRAAEYQLSFTDKAPYTLIKTPDFSEEDMSAAENIKYGCDIFYNRGGASGWMFMVYETLGISPSELMKGFSEFLKTKKGGMDPARITKLQCEYVMELFKEFVISPLFPPMEDVIKMHGGINHALAGGPVESNTQKVTDNTVIAKAPGTSSVKFHYFFDDLMQIGTFNLDEFVLNFKPEPNTTLFYNFKGEPKPLTIDKSINRLVNSFNGKKTVSEILKENSQLERAEALEFIDHGLAEGIINIKE